MYTCVYICMYVCMYVCIYSLSQHSNHFESELVYTHPYLPRKGTHGVSTHGVTASFIFLTGTCWVLPLTYVLSSQKCQGVPFSPNLSKLVTFAAAPFVSTPFVRNQLPIGKKQDALFGAKPFFLSKPRQSGEWAFDPPSTTRHERSCHILPFQPIL